LNVVNLPQARLYAFVDTAYLHGRQAAEVARELCAGGADLIQLRAKAAPLEEVQRLAEAILPITEAAGIPLVINDYPRLALAVRAPWCHLGQEDFFNAGYAHVSDLKRSLEQAPEGWHGSTLNSQLSTLNFLAGLRIGLSTHAPEQAQRAIAAGADYIAIGPVYATGTKPTAQPVTLDYVRWAAEHVRIPWFAIGGINLENLDAVLAAGARRICVVAAILNARDIARTCQQFKRRLISVTL
jgi:thiamine-phosphate pyrophosphorylase